jgi:alcohol dehydrogenase class IV
MNLQIAGMSELQIKTHLIEHIVMLKEKLNIIHNLGQKGVSADIIPALAEKAIKDPCNATNPKDPATDDLKAIYREAL